MKNNDEVHVINTAQLASAHKDLDLSEAVKGQSPKEEQDHVVMTVDFTQPSRTYRPDLGFKAHVNNK